MPFRTKPDRLACVFRSASLDGVSVETASRLRNRFGASTVVDLHHAGHTGAAETDSALRDVGFKIVHVAIRATVPSPRTRDPSSEDYADYYASMLEECAASFAVAFYEISLAAPAGVIFACRQGKDRTGLLAAALQEAVEVKADKILGDFARSGAALIRAVPEYRDSWEKRGLSRGEYLGRYFLGAAPLARLQNRLGGYGALFRRIISAAPTHLKMDCAIDTLIRLRGSSG
jgi:protein-tyrosine phosphatase